MSLMTTDNLSLSFGAFDVFKGVSVQIAADSKIGLVGPNGIGKTSLLLIMAELEEPTTGKVHIARGCRIGYLRQESIDAFSRRDNSVFSEMETVFSHLLSMQKRMHQMEKQMEFGDYTDTLLDKYGELQSVFERAGGYDYDVRIKQTLQGLGLAENVWDIPLRHLSGGQQTRALLARLLLERPDLLILDEPTNHLDTEAIEWLENTLSKWQGAVLIVSHDRFFLDNVVTTIWEMGRRGVDVYPGNYSAYVRQRQERWERHQKIFQEEKARLEKELDFIKRNIARQSTNARAVGLLKRLSRDLAIVERLGMQALRSDQSWLEMDLGNVRPSGVAEAERAIHSLRQPNRRPPQLNMRLEIPHNSGSLVFQLKNLEVGYPGNHLFSADQVELRRGECAVLIGPNGSGKTSFLKTLMGQLEPLFGEFTLGASLKVGYFAQVHDDLNSEEAMIDAFIRVKNISHSRARSHLARYLFRSDDVYKKVSALSGGERARLALAILALDGANFLLLDEPTNHLDIQAQEVLQEEMQSFAGTILLATHDRYLVNQLATQIWELRDGRLEVFEGTYRQFLERRTENKPLTQAHHSETAPIGIYGSNSRQRTNRNHCFIQAERISALESDITKREAALQRLGQDIQTAVQRGAFEEMKRLNGEYAGIQAELESMIMMWESLAVQNL